MELAMLVYGISLLDPFAILLQWIFGLAIITLIISCIAYCTSYNPDEIYEFWHGVPVSDHTNGYPGFKRIFWWIFPIIMLSIVIRIMLPSQKTAYVMVGAYATQTIALHPNAQQIGGKVLTIINQKLDYYVKEGQDELDAVMKKK